MIDYETYQRIQQLSERDGLSAPRIASELGLNPKTVRKYLKLDRFEPLRRGRRASKLDPFRARIRQLLNLHDYSAAQIFRMIREEGYEGGESVLRAHVAEIRPPRTPAYLTLRFEPGEAAQVDFAYCGHIRVGESNRRLYAFVMTLCHSRMTYAEFILRQSMEHFLQCHRNALETFGGVPRKVMVDNCKVAVLGSPRLGDPVVNPRYGELAAHYGFKVVPCGVRKPHEKGRVERDISYLKHNFLDGLEITTLEALNHGVKRWLDETANVRIHGTLRKRPIDLFKEEREAMDRLPLFPHECSVGKLKSANSQYRIVFESNRYSVPPRLAGRRVELRVLPDTLRVYHECELVAEHVRCYESNRDVSDPEHDKALLDRRRRARNARLLERFLNLGDVAASYYEGLKRKCLNPDLEARKIMALADVHGRDDALRAMADGEEFQAFSAAYVANIIDMRRRIPREPGPLHLSRKSDDLDIDFDPPDMEIYDVF